MSCCVLGITGLQLYWNYQNYTTIVSNFKKDANNALTSAVNKEISERHVELTNKLKTWLADTSFISIECNIENRDSSTVFTLQDVHPRFKEDSSRKAKIYSMGMGFFEQKLKKITPKAKAIFIKHFAEATFKRDLENGVIYYYTQGLGDSIDVAYNLSKVKMQKLNEIYKNELSKRGIATVFVLNKDKYTKKEFTTYKVNAALRRPFQKEMVWATLENPNQYYLRAMKWLIISSFLLISITLFCFYYTIRTLFNQYKLVAVKNQFISNMTHEINTPLSSIQITAEALQQFNPDIETRGKYLDIILYQTNKLNDLSKEILANAKLETLTFAMDEEIELNELITNIINDLNLKNNVDLTFQSNANVVLIKGNQSHLKRSISNVLENATKYNSSSHPVIEIKLTKKLKEINLTITDNGPGIADEFKQKIFEQFYRIPTGNIHDIKGYGLGLSYVKKVIAQHQGFIQVLDNHPAGSIFSIKLPS